MQILDRQPKYIENFTCMLCRKEQSQVKMTFRLGPVVGTLLVCPECATKEAAEVHELIKDKRPKEVLCPKIKG